MAVGAPQVANYSSGAASTGSVFTTGTLTIASGTNLVLFVSISWQDTAKSVVSVVWDAAGANQSLTAVSTALANSNRVLQWFRLINPTPGTGKTITVTFSTNTGNIHVGWSVFADVDQTTPVRAGTYIAETDASITITTQSGDATLSTHIAEFNITASNQTALYLHNGFDPYYASDYALSGGTSTTHTWGGSFPAGTSGFSLAQAAGGAAVLEQTHYRWRNDDGDLGLPP